MTESELILNAGPSCWRDTPTSSQGDVEGNDADKAYRVVFVVDEGDEERFQYFSVPVQAKARSNMLRHFCIRVQVEAWFDGEVWTKLGKEQGRK